ncbi:putative phage abortive infection protein [Pantoea agglomerans]
MSTIEVLGSISAIAAWMSGMGIKMSTSELWTAIGAIGAWVSGVGTLITAVVALVIARSQGESQKDINYKSWFDNTFTLLLEQHNSELKIIREYIKTQPDLLDLARSINGEGKDITAREACKFLRQDPVMSSYFRILYQLLKFIAEKHRPFNGDKTNIINQQKFYSSIVRSYIEKDIIGLIACNCLMVSKFILNDLQKRESNQYKKYRDLLVTFSFLEHNKIQTLSKKDAQRFMGYLTLYHEEKPHDFYKEMNVRDAILTLYKNDAFGDNDTLKSYEKLNHRGPATKGGGYYTNIVIDSDLKKMESDLLAQGF